MSYIVMVKGTYYTGLDGAGFPTRKCAEQAAEISCKLNKIDADQMQVVQWHSKPTTTLGAWVITFVLKHHQLI